MSYFNSKSTFGTNYACPVIATNNRSQNLSAAKMGIHVLSTDSIEKPKIKVARFNSTTGNFTAYSGFGFI